MSMILDIRRTMSATLHTISPNKPYYDIDTDEQNYDITDDIHKTARPHHYEHPLKLLETPKKHFVRLRVSCATIGT
jgi:hypothetical protein